MVAAPVPAARRRARFAPLSAEPAGYLLFAVWYFRLNAAVAGLQVVAAAFAGPPVGAGVRALAVLFALAPCVLYLWIARLLARRRRIGAYLTLALTGLSVLGAFLGEGGPLALVIPLLGLAVAFGAWRELEADVRGQAREVEPGEEAVRGARPRAGA